MYNPLNAAKNINNSPAASSGSLLEQVFANENAKTSNPGAAMSKCGPRAHAGFSLGQKFVPFKTTVVFTPENPGTLLVAVTFQHLPHPLDIQFPPPKLSEMAAVP
jgi:hypothetical protein